MATISINKNLLDVPTTQNFQQIRDQATGIADWARKAGGNVVIMQHTATDEQVADIEALSEETGKPVALIGGQLALMINVREQLLTHFVVVEAKTARISADTKQPDGSTKKTSVFKYEGLRVLN